MSIQAGVGSAERDGVMSDKTIIVTHTGIGGPVRVSAEDKNPAATAAGFLARREYGRRGTVGALRLDSWAEDGSSHTYEAFIGAAPTAAERRRGENGICGHNIWIYV